MSLDLADRYGTGRPRQRRVLIVATVLLAVVGLGWVVWAGLLHSTSKAASELNAFDIVDAHTATAVIQVDLQEATDPNCRIRALAVDKVVVGELNFEPTDGRNEVTIRTVREASAIDLVGCTAEGQARAQ